ncbi:MAG: glycosyltransferase family 2 protein [Planctomycetota bacterium]
MEKLVSILMVSYNAENYIEKTIKSCLEQTYQNIELLILDNNSIDGTLDVINSFHDSRIRFYKNNQNRGPYLALNYLLECANGHYVAIQDHDDIWFRNKIEKQVNLLSENQKLIACGVSTYFFYEKRGIFILIDEPFITNNVTHTSLVFRKNNFRYNPEYMLADEHFIKTVLGNYGEIACLKEPLCIHRIRSDMRNHSLNRISLSKKNIKDFIMINGLTTQSVIYFCHILTYKILPDSIMWFIRKFFTLKNREWISLNTFKQRHPDVIL